MLELPPVSGLAAVSADGATSVELSEAGGVRAGGLPAPDGPALTVHVGAAAIEAVALE